MLYPDIDIPTRYPENVIALGYPQIRISQSCNHQHPNKDGAMATARTRIHSPSDIGLVIQQARLARGLSQTALAEQLGLSQRSVSEIESGRPTIYMRKVFDLLRATGVELSAELPLEDE
ncbi:helix-turn-helix domain-containing protein [Microbacterium sp. UBA3394]|uniref:helix-turn-helix domain-containing protein n=2 Tax=Microbacterium TaxID=33882 RepID=UPI00257E5A7E|nr:helix-turn-helix domain-containing protein [Microbacterium sp. UBA3394]|tara:strand:- start:4207 stop:4563 length:357 start_codon:yes stop_codon:yes gene_type:complete